MKIIAPKYINQKSQSELSSLIKTQKRDLQKIKKQNSQSKDILKKMGQQNKNPFIKISKEVERFQDDLQKLEFKLNSQIKKNKLLKELNTVMQEEILNTKKIQELQNWQQISSKQKQIKKQEYDTQQILQKHNQEIAKINILRQQVCAQRSQRVVYSNLFKKLQNEIKIYEEEYKKILLDSLSLKNKKIMVLDQITQKKKGIINTNAPNIITRAPSIVNIFELTNSNKKADLQDAYQKIQIQGQTGNKMDTTFFGNKKSRLVEAMQQLQNYRIFFEKIKIQANVDDIQGLIEQIQNLEGEEQCLVKSIQKITNDINEKQRVLKKQKNYEKDDIFVNDLSNSYNKKVQQIKRIESLIQYQEEEEQEYIELISKISSLLNIDGECIEASHIEQYFKLIQEKLTGIKFLLSQNLNKQSSCDDIQLINDTPIQFLSQKLQKTEKYTQSQKILNKDTFKQQFSKELVKFRKNKSKKM